MLIESYTCPYCDLQYKVVSRDPVGSRDFCIIECPHCCNHTFLKTYANNRCDHCDKIHEIDVFGNDISLWGENYWMQCNRHKNHRDIVLPDKCIL
jgi:hypothetical protein